LVSETPEQVGDVPSDGLSAAELALFFALHYGIRVPPAELPVFASRESGSLAVSEEECRVALNSCLARGWFQVIDQRALEEMVTDLRARNVLGPIYGLPVIGSVDFTLAGARVREQFIQPAKRARSSPAFVYTDVVHSQEAHYFATRETALAAMEEYRGSHSVTSLTGPNRIGPWRAQWWRRFPDGFRLDVEERSQWQGRCSGGQGWSWERPPAWAADVPLLRHILDCHNVSLAEWLILAAIESTCEKGQRPVLRTSRLERPRRSLDWRRLPINL
jgi:hypothetical protein